MSHQKRRHFRTAIISAIAPASMFWQIDFAQAQGGGLLDGVPDKTVVTPTTVLPKPQAAPASPPTATPQPAPGAATAAQPPVTPTPSASPTAAGSAPPDPATASSPPAAGSTPLATPAQTQTSPAPAASAPAVPTPATPAPATPASAAPAAVAPADPGASKGMLDEVDAKPGVVVILPDTSATPTLQPPGAAPAPAGQPPAAVTQAPPVAPPAAASSKPAGAMSLADIIRHVLAAGVRFTPPAAGSPAAAALETIAQQCKKPTAEIAQAASGLSRPATVAKVPLVSTDQKEKGMTYAVTIPPPPTPLPASLSCIAASSLPAMKFELVVRAREFGPMDTQRIASASIAKVEQDLNAAFGDAAHPWRLATAEELLALLPVLNVENLWGPDGGQFWVANVLAGGEKVVVETKVDKQDYLVKLGTADAAYKATPVWIRARN